MPYLSNVTSVILAGGLGTRLRPLVSDKPKALAEINNRPFITYLFDQLITYCCKNVLLCTGYKGTQIEETLGYTYGPLTISYCKEKIPLGTAGSLRHAVSHIQSETILIMNGDSLCDARLDDFLKYHNKKESDATLLLVEVPDGKRYGSVEITQTGQIYSFKEKVEDSRPTWINAGVYLIKKRMIKNISPKGSVSLERDIFPNWIGSRFFGFPCHASLLDIGTPEAFLNAEYILKHHSAQRFISNDMRFLKQKTF